MWLTRQKTYQRNKILIPEREERLKKIGVVFRRNGKAFVAKVNGEVILSAGVIGSPQILMHSGVGPANHLKRKE